MKCPRRSENLGGVFKLPDEDRWLDDNTCNYCGSLNPDTMMARIEAGDVELIPTDKSYKIYVRNNGGEKFPFSYRNCVGNSCKGPDDCTHWVTEQRNQTKFYFQHLSVDQKQRFIEIHNDGKMKLGDPGRFYVTPFFTKERLG